MADSNKLWFEMGVRQNITDSLTTMLNLIHQLGGEMDKVVLHAESLDKVVRITGKKNGKALQDALKYQNMLLRIDETLRKISSRELSATVGVDKLDAARRQLEQFRDQLTKLQSDGKLWHGDSMQSYAAAFRNMMTKVNGLITAQNELERSASKTEKEQRKAEQVERKRAATIDVLAKNIRKVVEIQEQQGVIMSQVQNQLASYFSLYGIEHLLKSIIQIGGEFEIQHKSLQNILGDLQQGNALYEQMKELAVESPFNFRQLASYSKQLAAFGVTYEDNFDVTKRLADISAGLGVDMNRLILAYGQVKSAAVLRGQELRQFTEAGIPMVQALADEFTRLNGKATTTGEVFELISKRAVPFEMVKKVLWDMTNEGGRFYDMQYVLADTLAGKWSNLQDAWEIMLSNFAKGESLTGKFLKGVVTGLTNIVEAMDKLSPYVIGTVLGTIAVKSSSILGKMGGYDMSAVDTSVSKAQKLTSIELERMRLYGQINKAHYKEATLLNTSKLHYYAILGQEGKLNTFQLRRIIQQRNLTNARLQELLAAGKITHADMVQLRLWRMKYAQMSLFRLGLNSIGAAIKSLNAAMGPIGWGVLAVTELITALTIWSGKMDEIAQKNEEFRKSFGDRGNDLADYLINTRANEPSTKEDYEHSIDSMKEMLRQHSKNYDAIMQEASALELLSDRYMLLRNEIWKVHEANKRAEDLSDQFTDDARGYFEDLKDEVHAYYKALRGESGWEKDRTYNRVTYLSDRAGDVVRALIPDASTSDIGRETARQLIDAMLQEYGFSGKEANLVRMLIGNRADIFDATETLLPTIQSAVEKLDQAIVDKIRYGSQLDVVEKEKVQELVNKAIKDTSAEYPAFAANLQGLLDDSRFTAAVLLRLGDANANDLQISAFNAFPKTVDQDVIKMAMSWLSGGSMSNARKTAKQDIDERKNELDALGDAYNKGIISADKVAEKQSEYNQALYAALVGLGYDYLAEEEAKKNKGTKKDVALANAKSRVQMMKDVMSEWNKYRGVYGDKEGMRRMSLLFPDVDIKNIIDNYRAILRQIADEIGKSTPDRAKERISIMKLIGDLDMDDAKAVAKHALDAVEFAIKEQTGQWNLWKTLLDKTGNSDFAEAAFLDGRLFDGLSRSLRVQLKNIMSDAGASLDFGDASDLWSISKTEAEEIFGKGTDMLRLWEQIVDITSKNWADAMTKSADAMANMMDTSDKIAKIDLEIATLQAQQRSGAAGVNYNAQIAQKQRERRTLESQAFQESKDYILFYSAILTMTGKEAEAAGRTIKEQLAKELSNGTITAKAYTKAIKDVNAQLEKSRGAFRDDFMSFATGGVSGLNNLYWDKQAQAADEVERAQKELDKARASGDLKSAAVAAGNLQTAQNNLDVINQELDSISNLTSTLNTMLTVIDIINGVLNGLKGVSDGLSEMFDSIGNSDAANSFSDISDALSAVGSIFSPIGDAVRNILNGDIGGIISSVIQAPVKIFTNPISAFAALHDKRRQRSIEEETKRIKTLQYEYEDLEAAIESVLGGIYASGGYNEMYQNLSEQRDAIAKQLELEKDKKKSSDEQIEEYERQYQELTDKMKTYALDMAKSLYDIDLHSFADKLTDAIVSAWEKGEDAAEAYRDAVKDIMKDITTNILTKKVMEAAFEKLGIDDIISDMMNDTEGQLDPVTLVEKLVEAIELAGDVVVPAIEGTMNELEKKGYASKDSSTSNSGTNAIKSITEDQSNLLLSYVNAMRSDLSLHVADFQKFMDSVMPGLSSVFGEQLAELKMIEANTRRGAENSQRIYELLESVKNGVYKLSVKAA